MANAKNIYSLDIIRNRDCCLCSFLTMFSMYLHKSETFTFLLSARLSSNSSHCILPTTTGCRSDSDCTWPQVIREAEIRTYISQTITLSTTSYYAAGGTQQHKDNNIIIASSSSMLNKSPDFHFSVEDLRYKNKPAMVSIFL